MKVFKQLDNERGFALVLTLVMLTFLGILGAFALMTSTTEVRISANYSAAQQAFFAADRTLETAESFIGDGTVMLDDHTELMAKLNVGQSGPVPGAENRVEFLRAGPARGFGSSFQGRYYAITVTGGFFDADGTARSRTRLEAQSVGVSFSDAASGAQFETTGEGG